MKPILTFVFGAVAAAVLVFLLMRPGSAPETAPLVTESQEPATALPSERLEPAVPEGPAAEPVRPMIVPPAREAKTPKPTRKPSPPPVQTAENRTTPTVVVPQPQAPEPQTSVLTPAEPRERVEPKPTRVAQTVTIPAGTPLVVRIDQSLSSQRDQAGATFRASLDQPLVVDGFVIAEKGARVEGRVASVDPGGRVKGLALISLELVRLNTADGQRLRLQTDNFSKQAASDTKKDVGKVGIAAGIGAAIGAIAGGGRGAAIGAAAGGAAGTGGVMATRGKAAEVPAETLMTFKLRESIPVTEKLP